MKKILLTSSGFDSNNVLGLFKSLFDKEMSSVKSLFIPTAANSPEAIAVLPECMNDLLKADIISKNICVFDLHCNMEYNELCQYDVVYFTGGDTQYLLDRINNTGFNESLNNFVENGGVYVGVSAGSMVATNNLTNNLGFINCTLSVHTEVASVVGTIDVSDNPHIDLKDGGAILILDNKYEIV